MEEPALLVAALALLGYALLSRRLGHWWISMPAAMVVIGLLVGPVGLGLIEGDVHSELVKTVAELTLALMLFHDAVRIDLRALRVDRSVPLRLLGIGLPLMIVIGTAIAGQTFYNFTLENLRFFGTLKAMGATNGMLLRMILLQAMMVGAIGYGLGVGGASLFGTLMRGTELAFRLTRELLFISGSAIVIIIIFSAVISIWKVMRLEPAIVFKT